MTRKIYLGILLLVVMGYQNCSDSPFHAKGSGSSSLGSASGTGAPAALLNVQSGPQADAGDGKLIYVHARLETLSNLDYVLWDHIFGDDLVYCEQTTSLDKTETVFLCPSTGVLTVYLMAYFLDGSTSTYTLELDVEQDPDNGSNEPGKEPDGNNPLSGTRLYTQHCSGCHRALSSSTKKGISLNSLNNAINSVSQMNFLKGELSNEEKQAIVDALK